MRERSWLIMAFRPTAHVFHTLASRPGPRCSPCKYLLPSPVVLAASVSSSCSNPKQPQKLKVPLAPTKHVFYPISWKALVACPLEFIYLIEEPPRSWHCCAEPRSDTRMLCIDLTPTRTGSSISDADFMQADLAWLEYYSLRAVVQITL